MLRDIDRLRAWCEERVPEGARTRMVVELEETPTGAIVAESRAPRIGALRRGWARRQIARLRQSGAEGTWSVEWFDGRMWRRYSRIAPTRDIGLVIRELDRDAAGVFWRRNPGDSGGEERRRDVALA